MVSFRPLNAILALAMVLAGLVVAPATAGADEPPGDRRNFVVALMRNVGTESFVRLSEYSLREDHTIRADYWAWNAQTLHPRTPSGFTTSGCASSCKVWTPEGFEAAPSAMFGTWSISGHNLSITWTAGGQAERWVMSNYPDITRVELASHPTATDGWGWGSQRGFTTAATMSTIHANPKWYEGPRVINNYGDVTTGTEALVIQHDDATHFPNRLCNATCVNNSTLTNKVYLAGTGADRKVFHNTQLYEVDPAACIGGGSTVGAGHLKAGLQIIDDTGAFRGVVEVEASLYYKRKSSDILGIFDYNDIIPQ